MTNEMTSIERVQAAIALRRPDRVPVDLHNFQPAAYAARMPMSDIFQNEKDLEKYFENIIKENKLKGNELLVIGDGPVEIKECRKADGIAIGIASDEVRRYGLNQEKRSRLIKCGAQIIIQDFSQADVLVDLLFNKK